MDKNIEKLFTDAEAEIARRNQGRRNAQIEFRSPAALEQIADEMTLLRAEVRTLRFLFATWAAKR